MGRGGCGQGKILIRCMQSEFLHVIWGEDQVDGVIVVDVLDRVLVFTYILGVGDLANGTNCVVVKAALANGAWIAVQAN